MDRIVSAIGDRRSRMGCRHRLVRPAMHCCDLCDWSCRLDGSAGNTARRNPSPGFAGRRWMTSPNVPCRAGSSVSGAWEHLIPAGEGSLRPIDIDLTCRLMPGQEWSIIGDMHCLRCLGSKQQGYLVGSVQRRQTPCHARQRGPFWVLHMFCSCLEEATAFLDLQRDSLASHMLGREIVAEGGPLIPPCLDGEPMAANPRRGEAGFPAIVHHRVHCDTMPTRFVRRAPQQFRGEHIVAVCENISADRNALAHQSFHRKRPVRVPVGSTASTAIRVAPALAGSRSFAPR